jgi:uncharacterized Zn-finger protein
MKTHTGEGLNYSCEVSGCTYLGLKAFRNPKDLRTHMLVHEKSPIPCEVPGCGRAIGRRDNYLRHLRVKHADSPVALEILAATRSATQGSASSAASHASGSQELL